jgi:hypothetical protein
MDRIVLWDTDNDGTSSLIHVILARRVPGVQQLININIVFNEAALHRVLYPPPSDTLTLIQGPLRGLIICGLNPPEFGDSEIKKVYMRGDGDIDIAIQQIMIGKTEG